MNIKCSGCGEETSGSLNYAVRLPGLRRWFILPQCEDCGEKSGNRKLREQAVGLITSRNRQDGKPPEPTGR